MSIGRGSERVYQNAHPSEQEHDDDDETGEFPPDSASSRSRMFMRGTLCATRCILW